MNPAPCPVTLSADELDYARERIAIMIYDGGLTEEQARAEVEKLLENRRANHKKGDIS